MIKNSTISTLFITFLIFINHDLSADINDQWFCKVTQNCITELLDLPLNAAEVKRVNALSLELSRAIELEKKTSNQSEAEERQLNQKTKIYTQLAEACFDFRDEVKCLHPLEKVDEIVAGITFKPGLPKSYLGGSAEEHFMEFNWNQENKEQTRSWVKDFICKTYIDPKKLEEFNGLVLFSSSCFLRKEFIEKWWQKLIYRTEGYECTNVAYHSLNNKVYMSADFVFNARLFSDEKETQDLASRIFFHEMAHHDHADEIGEQEVDDFAALRFKRISYQYLIDFGALYAKYHNFLVLSDNPNASFVDIELYAEERLRLHQDFLNLYKANKIPIRWGAGSPNVLKAGFYIQGANKYSKHSMDNKYEYFAVAKELYCYDRKRAFESYSKKELQWLMKHTRCY